MRRSALADQPAARMACGELFGVLLAVRLAVEVDIVLYRHKATHGALTPEAVLVVLFTEDLAVALVPFE